MQTHEGKIRLLPAWPKEWDVDFKLRAPGQTTVEGKARSGRMTFLKVTPKERRNDVVLMNASIVKEAQLDASSGRDTRATQE